MTDQPPETQPTILSDEERAAALRAGSNPVPVKLLIRICLAMALVVAAITGLERFFGGGGVSPSPQQSSIGSTQRAQSNSKSPLTDLLGLKEISSATAANFTLTDQHGRPWTLSNQRGRVVVLTFFDSQCGDICPVLAPELADAEAALPPSVRNTVTFAVVNTNPQHTAANTRPPALTSTGLGRLTHVVFLTGPLSTLNSTWSNYGIQVNVTKNNIITHNNLVYFISPRGRLTALATPFGDESRNGKYRLGASIERRFGLGIAHIATNLERQ